MLTRRPAICAAEWIIPDTEAVDAMIEAVLLEQAWWIAVKSGKFAHRGVVWADGAPRSKAPKAPATGWNGLSTVIGEPS
jgi:hypothetical protein